MTTVSVSGIHLSIYKDCAQIWRITSLKVKGVGVKYRLEVALRNVLN